MTLLPFVLMTSVMTLALGADDVLVAGICGVDADRSRFPGQCNVVSC